MAHKQNTTVARNVALCYVRKSWVKDDTDLISPEIQRRNIQRVCDTNGWTPEWHEDVEGHKSGMHEKNRPGWLEVKARLRDGDIAALIANDLSRLHRRGWRIGDLLDFVDSHGVRLVLADPAKQMDFSTPQGRMFAQLTAIFDEWYAMDVSQRRKANIAHKKSNGQTVGMPPFGTLRDTKTQFLTPSSEGSWRLPGGGWQSGKLGEAAPAPGAVWRGYFDAARRVLELYVENHGMMRICQMIHSEGYLFRDRKGQPRPFDSDDVRRILANWLEYGGIVTGTRAKDRKHYDCNPDDVPLSPEKTVFDLDLLRGVGHGLRARSFSRMGIGQSKTDFVYPLTGLIYCAGCDRVTDETGTPARRSRLNGIGERNYRHRPGLTCDCKQRFVARSIIEPQFLSLVKSLTVQGDELALMHSTVTHLLGDVDSEAIEKQNRDAIARCSRRVEAAKHLFADGDIDRAEYLRRKQINEQEIARWQSYTTETQAACLQLTLCAETLTHIVRAWAGSDEENKRGMAYNLFEEIVYDLDTQRIVSWKLKAWAEKYIVMKASLVYQSEGVQMRPRQDLNL